MWKNLIQHLADQGLSQYAMAQAAGVSQSTICRLATGDVEPRYSTGRALIDLGGGVDALKAKGILLELDPASSDQASSGVDGVEQAKHVHTVGALASPADAQRVAHG